MTGRIRKILHVAFFSALIGQLGLVGCNTLEGSGEDLQEAGEEIEEESSD